MNQLTAVNSTTTTKVADPQPSSTGSILGAVVACSAIVSEPTDNWYATFTPPRETPAELQQVHTFLVSRRGFVPKVMGSFIKDQRAIWRAASQYTNN